MADDDVSELEALRAEIEHMARSLSDARGCGEMRHPWHGATETEPDYGNACPWCRAERAEDEVDRLRSQRAWENGRAWVACGGCRGEGAHSRFCPHRPGYHPWDRLAASADDIGDTIGGGEPALANAAYGLAVLIRERIREQADRA